MVNPCFVLNLATFLTSLGTDNNLVGFDPRGVRNSGPNLSCFPNGELGTSRFYHDIDAPIDYSDEKSYARAFERAAAFGDFCTKAHSAPNDTAKYANTVATVNDMRHYTELLAESKGQEPGKSKLWYYGLSYGTVLGTTFASLFPSRVLSPNFFPVGRIAVDGVVDAEDYYQGKWIANVAESDESFRYFFQVCYAAGEGGNCSFWADSPAAIEARFEAIVNDIEIRPIPVAIDTPAIVTASDLKAYSLQIPYSPLESFPTFADMLVELEQRNGTSLAYLLQIGRRFHDDCEAAMPEWYEDVEPRQFIACIDANDRYNLSTFDAWVQHTDTVVNMTRYFGEAWAPATSINCRKLNIKAPTSQVFEGYPSASKTSNPLFFLSTILDPVTPLRSAEKMTKRFGGASLLIQNSVGHTTIVSASECTSGYLRNYFDDGSLPEYGTHCEADQVPFGIRK
ncbi:TAP-like protein-domain-containing protein [Ampelomyces quisqualis]|uniref:TAP-like protein-domain-containing protein n=1 Tax=Ampelomyces quisqualis TaxID=50730 RepID=A0A6A5R3G2_AMPQU|nr:TAP-like protein-domain-containing protein [Ampelomyces quisqualis]